MSVRRILVLGATGGTGRHVVEQAAAMGLEVTTLVRSPDKLPATSRSLRVVTTSVQTRRPSEPRMPGRTRSFPYLASASHSHHTGSSPAPPHQ